MELLPNSIRRLRLDVGCDSADRAAALRTRLADLNHARLIPVIEQVLAEASDPAVRRRIERLSVDLGAFSPDEIETLVPLRLYSALSEALRHAVFSQESRPAQSEQNAWIDVLEIYLLTGTLPFPFSEMGSFSPGRILSELAETHSGELSRVLRRIGHNDEVLQRIVFQLLPEQLQALIRLLQPADAALILAYVADVLAADRIERVTDLSDEAFERRVWLLVLAYLLQDPGTQFNRRIFVRPVVTGIADFAGVAYEDILGILARALRQLMRGAGARSSLPAVIRELMEETSSPDVIRDDVVRDDPDALQRAVGALEPGHAQMVLGCIADVVADDRIRKLTNLDEASLEALVRSLVVSRLINESDSEFNREKFLQSLLTEIANFTGVALREDRNEVMPDLAGQVRRIARDRYALQQMVYRLLPEEFRALVRGLEPQNAELVLSDMVDVLAADRLQRLTSLDETNLELLLRLLIVIYLVDDPGSQFNRKSFVKSLIVGMAEHNNLSYQRILSLFGSAIEMSSTRAVLRSSLPGIISELLRESGIPTVTITASHWGSAAQLLQLLPEAGVPGRPIALALEAALSRISDREAFLARVVSAVRGGDLLDFERFAAEIDADAAPDSEDLVDELLCELRGREPRDGRLFLRAWIARSPGPTLLLHRLDPEVFRNLLTLLLDRPSAAVLHLTAACARLPQADRPRSDVLQAAILAETLRREPVADSRELLRDLLQTIFPRPLSERILSGLVSLVPEDRTLLLSVLNEEFAPRRLLSNRPCPTQVFCRRARQLSSCWPATA